MKIIKKAQLTVANSNFIKLPTSDNLSLSPSQEISPSLEKTMNTVKAYNKIFMQKGYEKLFAHRCISNVSFTEYDIYAYGHQGYLSGYVNDDMGSLDLTLERLNKHKAEAVILSEMSQFDLNVCMNQDEAYLEPINLIEDRHVFAKQILHDFYRDIKKYHPVYHRDKRLEEMIIYEGDITARRRIIHVPLSIGIWAAEQKKTNVVLGAPHPLLVHEDLSLCMELDELKEIWKDMTESYIEK